MATPAVRHVVAGGVAEITLDRPQNLNALSPEVIDGLRAAVAAIAVDPDIRVTVVRGAGRAFCAGGDLRYFRSLLQTGSHEAFISFLRRVQDTFNQMEALSMPTIAAVQGTAVAGGLELALCCDLIVAGSSARLGDGHAKYGVIPGGGGSLRLLRKLPANIAHELFFTGELVSAQRMAEYGLVNRVVADADLDAAVKALADRIADNSPLGLRWMKRLVRAQTDTARDAALNRELEAFRAYLPSADLRSGLEAFAQHAQPRFSGR